MAFNDKLSYGGDAKRYSMAVETRTQMSG